MNTSRRGTKPQYGCLTEACPRSYPYVFERLQAFIFTATQIISHVSQTQLFALSPELINSSTSSDQPRYSDKRGHTASSRLLNPANGRLTSTAVQIITTVLNTSCERCQS